MRSVRFALVACIAVTTAACKREEPAAPASGAPAAAATQPATPATPAAPETAAPAAPATAANTSGFKSPAFSWPATNAAESLALIKPDAFGDLQMATVRDEMAAGMRMPLGSYTQIPRFEIEADESEGQTYSHITVEHDSHEVNITPAQLDAHMKDFPGASRDEQEDGGVTWSWTAPSGFRCSADLVVPEYFSVMCSLMGARPAITPKDPAQSPPTQAPPQPQPG